MLAGDEKSDELLRRADQALHRSKREGRNRVTQAIAPGQNAAPDVSSC
jgi:PleD family two-component response regulator